MNAVKYILLLCFFSFLHCSVTLATPSLRYNVSLAPYSNSLSQPTITAVYKDKTGFLWVGTQSGLNRYDGSKNTVYSSGSSTNSQVPASYISQISEDPQGHIWIATYGGGLAKFDQIENSFTGVSNGDVPEYRFLKSMYISKVGNIWFGTRDSGIGMYDPVLQRYATWLASHPLNKEMGQPFDIVEDNDGRIWAGGNGGLYLVDPNSQSIEFFPVQTDRNVTTLLSVTAIEYNTSDTIWVGVSTGHLLQFNLTSRDYSKINIQGDFQGGWINDLAYKEGELWVAADNGVTIIETASFEATSFTQKNSPLTSDFAICLLVSQHSVLTGTARGLNVFTLSSFENYQSMNSQIFDDISSFAEDSKSNLWIGTFNGVFRLDEKIGLHTPIDDIYEGTILKARSITAMNIKDDQLWLGFFRGGIQVVDLSNGSAVQPNLPMNDELAITSIINSQDGSVWIGTYNQGLYQIKGKVLTSYYTPSDIGMNIPEVSIMFLMETSDSKILAGTDTRIFEVDYENGVIRDLKILQNGPNESPVIISVGENSNGDIWIGVKDKGIYIWRATDQKKGIVAFDIAPGNSALPSPIIYAIEFDDNENSWVSTSNGIVKLNSTGDVLKIYSVTDGLQGSDFNLSSSFKDSQGRIYFGGSNGYNRFDPSHEIAAPPPPAVILTQLNIAGKTPVLPVAVHELRSIELSYKDYFVSFDFSVLDFTDPEKNRYRYKLKNFDPEWIEIGTRNNATFTNLPSGNYTFRVQGANSRGVWNREGITIELVVHPTPWFSWQAYILYLSIFSVMLMLAKKYYDNIVLRRQATIMAQEMHEAADQATDDLQEQLEYQDQFVKIVHDHSTRTLKQVSSFIREQARYVDCDLCREAVLSSNKRVEALSHLELCLFYQGDEFLANMTHFTNRVISQLLEVYPETSSSITTINEIPSRLISVHLATPLSILIYELLDNCFLHAFEARTSANYIQISIEEITDENGISVTQLLIVDNGIGIPDNISFSSIETSGLAIVSSIVHNLNGTISLQSREGTTISLCIPNDDITAK